MDLQRAEQALRAAHAAGDADAARRIVEAIQAERGAPTGPTAGSLLESSPLPSHAEAQERSSQMAGTLNEAAGNQIAKLPGYAADALDTTATHYRQLGRMAGLPLDPPAPEDQKRYQQAVIEMLLTTGGGKLGQMGGERLGDVLKYLGRGNRTRLQTDMFIREATPRLAGMNVERAQISDLLGPTVTGTLAGTAVDVLGPSRLTGTQSEFIDNPVAAGAGVMTAARVGKNTIDELLLTNPSYRDLVTRGHGGSPLSTAIGAAVGYLLANGINLGAEGIDAVVRAFTGEDAPARGGAMLGPVGGAGVPVDPDVLSQRLIAPQQFAGASDVTGPLPPRISPPKADLEERFAVRHVRV